VLIDAHAHFYTERTPRGDWQRLNERRLEVGRRLGLTAHVASILGSYGGRSPTYFPSPDDVDHANDAMLALQHKYRGLVFGYCVVNPNYPDHAQEQIERRAADGMIGVKLAASRPADDQLLDPIAAAAAACGLPILHHVWHGLRRDWPGQDASDAAALCRLAARHPSTKILMAHIGGGGDWSHSLREVADANNVWVDLSGSGVDTDMIHRTLEVVGAGRMVWGADLTLDTAWGKLRYIESLGLSAADLEAIRAGNARTLFPAGVFDGH